MKFVSFLYQSEIKIGAVIEDEVVDFSSSKLPKNMIDFIKLGESGLDHASSIIKKAKGRISLNDVKLIAPVPKPNKILAVGLNYKAHKKEVEAQDRDKFGKLQDDYPIIFNKQNTSVTGPYDNIHRPKASHYLDYEGELGFIIGKKCRHVPYDYASNVIYGYTIVNDVSIRDWQMRGPPITMTLGKSWDTHCPYGPYIVTSDEVGNPHALRLETHVNGDLKQSTSTSDLIFNCFSLVEYLSTVFTLEPGDLISTGTPAGVAMTTKDWLQPGDEVRVSIEKLGSIKNIVIDEPDDTIIY